MWLVQGTFTTEQPELISTKLLKPATQYPCGRKIPKDALDSNKIFLAGKGASRQSGTFIVGDIPDNLHSDAVLSIKLPDKDKPRVLRNGAEVEADTDDTIMLNGGDVIRKGITIKVIHEVVYAYATPSVNRDVVKELAAQAREFGVRVTRTWSHLTTHYLLEQVPEHENGAPAVYPIEMLCGLLNGSHFVTTSWLKEFLGKAKLPRGSGNLEEVYNPPKAEEYQPSGSLSELWQPSDSRQGLFKDVNFVVIYDGSEPKKHTDSLIAAGSGSMQTYSVSSDKVADTPEKWSRYIRRARSKKGTDAVASTLVLLGLGSDVLKANEDWTRVFLQGAQDMDMRIVFEEDLALAILHADLSYINCSLGHELPQRASHSNQTQTSPSPAQFPTAKMVRSTLEEPTFDPNQPSSSQLSKARDRGGKTGAAPSARDEAAAPLPPPRRPRVPASRNALFGLEDDSIMEDEEPASRENATSSSFVPEVTMLPPDDPSGPSQSLPLARPRRRGETQSARNRMSIFGIEDEDDADNMVAEPISKRFRADFESNLVVGTLLEDVDLDLEAEAEDAGTDSAPQTLPARNTRRSQSVLSDTAEPGRGGGTTRTWASQSQPDGQRRIGSKSKRVMLSDVEEDSQGAEGAATTRGQSKRRAVENVHAVVEVPSRKAVRKTVAPTQPLETNQANAPAADKNIPIRKPEQQTRGAAATGTDTAPEFLQALASKKKGKRKEDAFDREFNNLRITAPRFGAGPDLEQERARAEELEVWDELSKDMNITGNFMVVIETDDILRKDGGRREHAPLPDDGVPNFKRFKKKAPQDRPPPVELFAEPTVGYGEGSEYWEQDQTGDMVVLNSQSPNQNHSRSRPRPRPRGAGPVTLDSDAQTPPPAPTGARKRGAQPAQRVVSSDDDAAFMKGNKANAKAKSKAKAKTKVTPRKKKEVPEYYSESESEEVEVVRPRPRTRGKVTAVIQDDEEDFGDAMAAIPDVDDSFEDNTLKSSGPPAAQNVGRRKTRAASASTGRNASPGPSAVRGRKAASGTAARKRVRADSDSSDAVAFKGSAAAAKKRTKR